MPLPVFCAASFCITYCFLPSYSESLVQPFTVTSVLLVDVESCIIGILDDKRLAWPGMKRQSSVPIVTPFVLQKAFMDCLVFFSVLFQTIFLYSMQ